MFTTDTNHRSFPFRDTGGLWIFLGLILVILLGPMREHLIAYRAFPRHPVATSLSEAAGRAGEYNWVRLSDLQWSCKAGIWGEGKSKRLFIPARDHQGQVAVILSMAGRCEEVEGRPVTGVLDKMPPARLDRVLDLGLPKHALPMGQVYELSMEEGPSNSLAIVLFTGGVALLQIGILVLLRIFLRPRRRRRSRRAAACG